MARRRPSVARPAGAPRPSTAAPTAASSTEPLSTHVRLSAWTAKRPSTWTAAALVLLTVVAYGPAFRADFIWDDDAYVTENATLDDFHGLPRIWLEPGAVPQYYPLTFTSLWVEHQLFGDRATGYHVTNVLLHALNAVVVL